MHIVFIFHFLFFLGVKQITSSIGQFTGHLYAASKIFFFSEYFFCSAANHSRLLNLWQTAVWLALLPRIVAYLCKPERLLLSNQRIKFIDTRLDNRPGSQFWCRHLPACVSSSTFLSTCLYKCMYMFHFVGIENKVLFCWYILLFVSQKHTFLVFFIISLFGNKMQR